MIDDDEDETQYCILTTILKDDGFTVIEEFGSGERPTLEGAILETIDNLIDSLVESSDISRAQILNKIMESNTKYLYK